MKYVVTHEGEEHQVEVFQAPDGGFLVSLDGEECHADIRRISEEDTWSLLLDGRSYDLLMIDGDRITTVIHHGRSIDFCVESERQRNARLIVADVEEGDGETVRAVMPGIVVSVEVQEGAKVTPGDSVVVLEAMKMENEIRVNQAGVVKKLHVKVGQTVNAGDVLVELE